MECSHGALEGWYSARLAERLGTNFYRAEDGREVEVTHAHCPPCGRDIVVWPDKMFVARVTSWVRPGRPPMQSREAILVAPDVPVRWSPR